MGGLANTRTRMRTPARKPARSVTVSVPRLLKDDGLVSSQEGATTVLHELMHTANPDAAEEDVEVAAPSLYYRMW